MAAQQPFVAFHLGGSGFIGSLVGGILQGNIPRVDGGNQLSFPDPLSFHYRKVDDCPLTRNASFTYSTASTMPEKSLSITDCELTVAVFTGRTRGISSPFFCPQDVTISVTVRANRYIFFICF